MGVSGAAASACPAFVFASVVRSTEKAGGTARLPCSPQLILSPSLSFHLSCRPWYLKPSCRHFECSIHPLYSSWGGSPISSGSICQGDSNADKNPHRGLEHLPFSKRLDILPDLNISHLSPRGEKASWLCRIQHLKCGNDRCFWHEACLKPSEQEAVSGGPLCM